jgi:hypothetical protein
VLLIRSSRNEKLLLVDLVIPTPTSGGHHPESSCEYDRSERSVYRVDSIQELNSVVQVDAMPRKILVFVAHAEAVDCLVFGEASSGYSPSAVFVDYCGPVAIFDANLHCVHSRRFHSLAAVASFQKKQWGVAQSFSDDLT